MKKLTKMNEAAWLLGTVLCALGVALCTKSGFGLSMIAAPPYILSVKLSSISSFFTQGACEYLWQGFLMILLCIGLKRFKISYLLSFVTGILFGLAVDGWFLILGSNAVAPNVAVRIAFLIFGEIITTLSIAFYFRTALPLAVYELVVTEISDKFGFPNATVKQFNDIFMLLISIALALVLNGSLNGIGFGTVFITIVNAPLINMFGKLLDRYFEFSFRFKTFERLFGKRS
jgi:uncharacterized membrane protein YczE